MSSAAAATGDRIAVLPAAIAAQIAAGEVIERPASVVKELVENACDAGASRVTVEVEGGGIELIRVHDDGRGMTAAALSLAFERHATSKLRAVEDLAALTTYGFRGEALPSVVAAAEVECRSRAAGTEAGARVRFAGGRVLGVEAAGAPPGTTIEVRDLFARQPARRAFLAGPRAERAAIARVCSEAALARPDVALRLSIDGRTLLSSPGGADGPAGLRRACMAVWGAEAAGEALAFAGTREVEGAVLRAWGLAAAPSHHRGRRGGVSLFVNRRPVASRRLGYAVEEAYAELLPQRRFPVAAVFLELPPDRVDVNVHPTKAEVKLRDDGLAFGLIQRAIRSALLGGPPAEAAQPEAAQPKAGPLAAARAAGLADAVTREAAAVPPAWQRERPSFPGAGPDDAGPIPASPFRARPRPVFDLARGGRASDLARGRRPAAGGGTWTGEGAAWPRGDEAERSTLPGLPLLRLVGQLRETFVVAEGPAGLVLVDQHAAHERVLYERLLGRTADPARQELLDPPLLELTPPQAAAWSAHGDGLTGTGFVVEEFGARTVRLRAVPAALGERDARAALFAVLDDLAAEERTPAHHDPAVASAACHASVRAGQGLSAEEMRALLRDLESCANPHTCPHGRPTVVEIGATELYRRFGRST